MADDMDSARDNDRLQEILAEILLQAEQGLPVDRQHWIARHPEYAGEISQFVDNRKQMSILAGQLKVAASSSFADQATLGPLGVDVVDDAVSKVRYFGDYELHSEIARGGMGVVFMARQVNLNRMVALKMILSGTFADAPAIRRFQAEAEAAAALDHPNIVPIFEVGEHQGQHYFSMAYVEGGSLANRLANGPLAPKDAATLMKTVAEAVQFAHEHGVIHRDLKPANILIDMSGEPKVTDFGLAKRYGSHTDGSPEQSPTIGTVEIANTATGEILGTPSYMPPEQASGRVSEIGPAADIYSLGALLYAALTGRPPFQAASQMDTLIQVLHREPVPPRQLNSQIPRDLETISLKCLQKDPRRRYSTSRELADDLDRWLNFKPIVARPTGGIERLRLWIIRRPTQAALVAITLLGLTISLWQWRRTTVALDQAEFGLYANRVNLAQRDAEAGSFKSADATLGLCPEKFRNWEWNYLDRYCHQESRTINLAVFAPWRALVSPDGTKLAIGGYGRGIQIRDINGEETLANLETTNDAWFDCMAWTSDSKSIAIGSKGQVAILDASSGRELRRWKAHSDYVREIANGPNSTMFTASLDTSLKKWDLDRGTQVLQFRHPKEQLLHVACSPDGNQIASLSGAFVLRVWDARTGKEAWSAKSTVEHVPLSVAFSPNGQHIANGGYGHVKLWELSTGHVLGKLTVGKSSDSTVGITHLGYSRDGTLLVGVGNDQCVYVWDVRAAKRIGVLTGHFGTIESAEFNADGSTIITAGCDGTVRFWKLADCLKPEMKGMHKATINSVRFSPDGSLMASASSDKSIGLWDAQTRKWIGSLNGHTLPVQDAVFSPDGQSIASCSARDRFAANVPEEPTGELIIWRVSDRTKRLDLSGSGYKGGVVRVLFSRDGRRLISGGTDNTVRIWNVADGKLERSIDTPFDLGNGMVDQGPIDALTLDGEEKVLAVGGTYSNRVQLFEFKTGRRIKVLQAASNLRQLAFSPDGSLLAAGTVEGVNLFEVRGHRPVRLLRGHEQFVMGVAFSPDGTRLASCAENVRIWDVNTGQEVLRFSGPSKPSSSIEFSPDGARLAVGGFRDLHIWDAAPRRTTP